VLLGLRMGVFTPSEIGVFAVVYGLVIGFAVYRKLSRKSFPEALEGSLADVGSVMFLIALFVIVIGFVIDATVLIFLPGLVLFVPNLIFGS